MSALALPMASIEIDVGETDAGSGERLARRFRDSRDAKVFDELVRRYQASVFRIVAATLGPDKNADVEDCVQEVFIDVFYKIGNFRFQSRFSTWLYRVARNKAVDVLRKPRFRLPHVDSEAVKEQIDAESGFEEQRVVEATDQRVRNAVQSLPTRQRSVVYLFYWMEVPIAEIAELMSMKSGTVKSELYRARQRLAKQMGVNL
jgi:RNA polymerase sigma-70 factor (ECF subfamily)